MDITQKKQKNSIYCPECDTEIHNTKKISLGMIIECPACGIESEIIKIDPFKLSPLEEEK